jgi:hypothetical protein
MRTAKIKQFDLVNYVSWLSDNSTFGSDEVVLWRESPHRLPFFFYLAMRVGTLAFTWVASWTFIAGKRLPITNDWFGLNAPKFFAMWGVIAIAYIPFAAMRCKRFTYIFTTHRTIIEDSIGTKSRFAFHKDVHSVKYKNSMMSGFGSLEIYVGYAKTPEGDAKLVMPIIALSDASATKAIKLINGFR